MKALKHILLILCLSALFTSCSNDDENNTDEFDGSIESIENFYTPELLDALVNLGFNINTGENPPIVNGDYLLSPNILEVSNVSGDQPGNSFNNVQIEISNQSNESLTLNFNANDGGSIEGIESYISGSGNNFSIFLKVENTTPDNHTWIGAYAYSGTLTSEGFTNFQFALIMLDDLGDPNNNLIENNSGRLFIDEDGLVEKVNSADRVSISLSENLPHPGASK